MDAPRKRTARAAALLQKAASTLQRRGERRRARRLRDLVSECNRLLDDWEVPAASSAAAATENPSSAAAVELETWGASAETPSRALRSRRKAKLNQLEAEVEQLRALVPTADAQAIAPRPVAPQRESFEYDAAYRRARYSHQTHCIEWLESERARLREALAHQQGVSTGLLSVVRGPVDDD